MNIKPDNFSSPTRPFWLQFLILMGIDTAIVLVLALIFRNPVQISNFYFISSIIFLIIAIVPIFSEVGGNMKKIRGVKEQLTKGSLKPIEKNVAGNNQSRNRSMFLYGLAGLVAFILSILTIGLG